MISIEPFSNGVIVRLVNVDRVVWIGDPRLTYARSTQDAEAKCKCRLDAGNPLTVECGSLLLHRQVYGYRWDSAGPNSLGLNLGSQLRTREHLRSILLLDAFDDDERLA